MEIHHTRVWEKFDSYAPTFLCEYFTSLTTEGRKYICSKLKGCLFASLILSLEAEELFNSFRSLIFYLSASLSDQRDLTPRQILKALSDALISAISKTLHNVLIYTPSWALFRVPHLLLHISPKRWNNENHEGCKLVTASYVLSSWHLIPRLVQIASNIFLHLIITWILEPEQVTFLYHDLLVIQKAEDLVQKAKKVTDMRVILPGVFPSYT